MFTLKILIKSLMLRFRIIKWKLLAKEPAIIRAWLIDDKTLKVLYNASAYEQEKDEKIRNFLHYVYTNETGEDDFSNRLEETVKKLIENDKFRNDYLAMNLHDRDITRMAKQEGIAEGMAKGIEQGALQKAIESAIELLKEKIAPEVIAK